MNSNPLFISFGFRCSSAGILKKLQLKQESYPFDWLISRLPIIMDCIDNKFSQFLKKENYVERHTNTYEMSESTNGFICDEYIQMNTYYQPKNKWNAENTYQYGLAMNHRQITNIEDYDYYTRCVQRFREHIIDSIDPKIYIHITPLITSESYVNNEKNIFNECELFDDYIFNHVKGEISGLIFIMVKTEKDFFNTELLHTSTQSGTRFYVIYTNRDFIDAGETFMGNYYYEQQFIENTILNLTK
jgi:hypothetical protein